MDTIVSLADLTHDYGNHVALDHLDVAVPAGVTGLVGANGAGKTTMLRILLGLLHPTAGSVTVLGHDALADPLSVRAQVGYMPEGSALPKDQTAADFVAYTAQMAGLPSGDARRRASETLFLVGLAEERFRFLGDFSTGMAQRVKLAQAIVHGPRLILLDEPASGLDPDGRVQMLELIRRLGSFGINVIVSSHVLSDIESTCDYVVMLDAGRLVRSGPVVGSHSTSTVSVEIVGPADRFTSALAAAGVEYAVDRNAISVIADGDDVFDAIRDAAAASRVGIMRLERRSFTLEDEFLRRADV
ncbi:MAG: ABC transporter ATP-binding protein [Acidimicrobiia bacterium]|nr:ABC transporter ATP-binding protein [Acidimicrobiia bacterium]